MVKSFLTSQRLLHQVQTSRPGQLSCVQELSSTTVQTSMPQLALPTFKHQLVLTTLASFQLEEETQHTHLDQAFHSRQTLSLLQ